MFRDQETAEQAITGVWYYLFDCDDIELVNEARALMAKWAEEYCGGLDESIDPLYLSCGGIRAVGGRPGVQRWGRSLGTALRGRLLVSRVDETACCTNCGRA